MNRPVLAHARDMYLGVAPALWGDLHPHVRPLVDHVIGEIRRVAAYPSAALAETGVAAYPSAAVAAGVAASEAATSAGSGDRSDRESCG